MSSGGLLETFALLRSALHRFLCARGASAAEADDILQEVSLKLAETETGPVGQPRAYLYKMASNHFLLHRRTETRRARREGDWVDAQDGDWREADPRPHGERTLIDRQHLAIVRNALGRLPDRTRRIFARFRIDGEPQRLIAHELGISVSAVEKHLTRAYAEIAGVRNLLDGDRPLPRHLNPEQGDI